MTYTGGDAIRDALVALGVEKVFSIVSVHNVPVFDAVARRGGFEIVCVRHEQAAAHAADGYARATGKLGVVLASTGPGTTNTMTGLYEASFASSPVLLLTGQVQTRLLGRSKAMLHEAEQQLAMLSTLCRRVESPRRPDDIVPAIYRVAKDILSGRAQPGAVEIPIDLQHGPAPEHDSHIPAGRPVLPDADGVTSAAELLGSVKRRLIWAGGGVVRSGASAALVALAEALDAPVLTSVNGRGVIPEDHPLSMGAFTTDQAVRAVLSEAEAMLAVGTRFRWGDTGQYTLELPPRLVHLDVDPDVMGRSYEPEVRILGDARLGLEVIAEQMGSSPDPPNRRPIRGDPSFTESAQKAAHAARETTRATIGADYEAIADHIREAAPRDAPIVRDATVPAYLWGDRLLPVYEPGTSINPTSAAIGPGLPLAIGAAAGTVRPTVVIHGDGGFMLHATELATAAQYGLPLKVCLFDDGGYGVLRGIQAGRYEGRTIGVDLHTPDFAALASSMGVGAEKVSSAEDFREAFDRAMATDGPYLLHVDMSALGQMRGMGAPRRG